MKTNYQHSQEEYDRLIALNDGLPLSVLGTKRRSYLMQRRQAGLRGVPWEFTFEEWVRVWEESGKWSQRGSKKGQFVMARHGDVGPYNTGNVSIVTAETNNIDGASRRKNPFGNLTRVGTGAGYTFCRDRRDGLHYNAKFRHKSLGFYATPDEAAAVYRAAVAAYLASNPDHPAHRHSEGERIPGFGSAALLKVR
jgi:hypothetical protein